MTTTARVADAHEELQTLLLAWLVSFTPAERQELLLCLAADAELFWRRHALPGTLATASAAHTAAQGRAREINARILKIGEGIPTVGGPRGESMVQLLPRQVHARRLAAVAQSILQHIEQQASAAEPAQPPLPPIEDEDTREQAEVNQLNLDGMLLEVQDHIAVLRVTLAAESGGSHAD